MTGNNVDGVLLIVIVAFVLLVYVLVAPAGGVFSAPGPRRFRTPFRPDLKDVGQQLYAVMAASFQRRQLLNRSEYQTFKIIEDDIAAERRGYRVFAQTSLGEVLTTPKENGCRSITNENGFRSINSKRVDILIVDRGGWPIVAVEYQGSGHYQGDAAGRDAVKKEALCKAGVRYLEVFPSDSPEQIRSRVREQLGWKAAA